MPNILHRITLEKAAPVKVYQAAASPEGLASWLTENVLGVSQVGKVLQFRFGTGGPDFEVLELTPLARVRWKCVAGPSEWIDTRISLDIREHEGETVVLFRHAGWREEGEFMHHCSTQRGYFLIGLKQLLDGDRASPYGPRFTPISRWSR